ncbi:hypothetical protein BGX38DRAFT_1279415 [Terfezia claveryi]|nr:hypothetical protein BGX38DRAFT_1279415 [Terfezia claveryi]
MTPWPRKLSPQWIPASAATPKSPWLNVPSRKASFISKKSCLRPVRLDAQDAQDAQDENSRSGRQCLLLLRRDALAAGARAWDATHCAPAPGTQHSPMAGVPASRTQHNRASAPRTQHKCAPTPGTQHMRFADPLGRNMEQAARPQRYRLYR